MMNCKNCGKQMDQWDAVCPHCGKSVYKSDPFQSLGDLLGDEQDITATNKEAMRSDDGYGKFAKVEVTDAGATDTSVEKTKATGSDCARTEIDRLPTGDKILCSACGASISPRSQFCSRCGSKQHGMPTKDVNFVGSKGSAAEIVKHHVPAVKGMTKEDAPLSETKDYLAVATQFLTKNKKPVAIASCVLVICIVAILIISGLSKSNRVPDSTIQMLVQDCEHFDLAKTCEWNATHDVDADSHVDTVDITLTVKSDYGTTTTNCTVVYRYDRSTDLWSVYRSGEWSDPSYTYSSNLVGEWDKQWYDCRYVIIVKAVNENSITVECEINESVYEGLFTGDVVYQTTVEGTYPITAGGYVKIPFNLPSGSYRLNIHLNPDEGISYAYATEE